MPKQIFRKLNRGAINDEFVGISSQIEARIDQVLKLQWIPVLIDPVNNFFAVVRANYSMHCSNRDDDNRKCVALGEMINQVFLRNLHAFSSSFDNTLNPDQKCCVLLQVFRCEFVNVVIIPSDTHTHTHTHYTFLSNRHGILEKVHSRSR